MHLTFSILLFQILRAVSVGALFVHSAFCLIMSFYHNLFIHCPIRKSWCRRSSASQAVLQWPFWQPSLPAHADIPLEYATKEEMSISWYEHLRLCWTSCSPRCPHNQQAYHQVEISENTLKNNWAISTQAWISLCSALLLNGVVRHSNFCQLLGVDKYFMAVLIASL